MDSSAPLHPKNPVLTWCARYGAHKLERVSRPFVTFRGTCYYMIYCYGMLYICTKYSVDVTINVLNSELLLLALLCVAVKNIL